MIIHSPEIKAGPEEITARSKIEFQTPNLNFPDELWFKFPVTQTDLIAGRSDGFLAAMLLLAMRYGENILVHGEVSPRLLTGIEEYQRVFNMWFPNQFRLIDIECDSVSILKPEPGTRSVVCAFSGGVDSFFSLWKHLPANDSDESSRITHILFAHGFDIRLENKDAYCEIRDSYADMSHKLDIEFLTASTNHQKFGTRPHWGIFHGSVMIGMAHILGRHTSKFYVPASHTYRDLVPWGSDPRIDHLLSTEAMEVIHDGASYTRIEKTEVLSRWNETYKRLRVCSTGDDVRNCSVCEKCLRTMVTLDMFGALERYDTFDTPIQMKLVSRCRYFNASDFAFPREIISHAFKLRRWDIVSNVSYAYIRSRILQLMRFVKRRVLRLKRPIFN